MELIEIARGHITLQVKKRTITIYGEALLRGHGSPDFVVYSNTIQNWDIPDDRVKITEEEKHEILKFLRKEFFRKKMVLEIE